MNAARTFQDTSISDASICHIVLIDSEDAHDTMRDPDSQLMYLLGPEAQDRINKKEDLHDRLDPFTDPVPSRDR